MELLYDSNRGIYIPQTFAKECSDAIVNREQLANDLETLKKGPDEEWYWNAWANVLDNAKLRNKITGTFHTIYQHDGDLWVLGESEPFPEEWTEA